MITTPDTPKPPTGAPFAPPASDVALLGKSFENNKVALALLALSANLHAELLYSMAGDPSVSEEKKLVFAEAAARWQKLHDDATAALTGAEVGGA